MSGVPTQLLLTGLLFVAGVRLFDGDEFSLEFFATLSLLDTALIALLVRLFLALSGERSEALFGSRRVGREVGLGLALIPVVLVGVIAIVAGLRALVPSLHNVEQNPLEAYMRSPLDASIFAFVVVLAGGVREELMRGFILHRFDQCLGGRWVGLAVFSLWFGALHLTQGVDVAVAISALGVLWGLLYLRRGSIIAPMINHAGFDAAQVLQVVLARTLGAPISIRLSAGTLSPCTSGRRPGPPRAGPPRKGRPAPDRAGGSTGGTA